MSKEQEKQERHKDRRLTFYADEDLISFVKNKASSGHRSVSRQMQIILERYVKTEGEPTAQ